MKRPSTGGKSRHRAGPEFWLRFAAVVLLVPGVTACPPKCPVTELEIVPSTVTVGSDPVDPTSFVLEARLWSGPASERVNISIAEHPECKLTWKKTGSWPDVAQSGDYRARITVAKGLNPTTPAFVKVTAGDVMTTTPGAEIRVVPSTVTGQDVVRAQYIAGRTPGAVVVNGTRSALSAPNEPWLSAFVRTAAVGQEEVSTDDPRWAAAVLEPQHGMVMYAEPWTPGNDQIGPPPSPPVAVRTIPVALRIAVEPPPAPAPDLVLHEAKLDIAAANVVLAENRVGVALEALDIKTIVGSEFADCLSGDALTPVDDQPGMLHVVYLNKIGNLTGLTCPATDERRQPVIYIASGTYSLLTLAHEVGHVLGLVVPIKGHAENSPGLDASNVMSNVGWDRDPFGRQRFTVGQAFRMNVDAASWLNWATATATATPVRDQNVPLMACQCGATDPAGRCPRLSDDVARRRGGLGDAQAWDCDDKLKLPAVGYGERAAGLLAGRRWRDPPGKCTPGLPGSRVVGTNLLHFANLTRPGKCASWAAVFFSDHTPIYQKLVERSDMVWTDASERWLLSPSPALEAKRLVTVGVYYSSSSEPPEASSQIEEARRVFGDGNPTGLDVIIVAHSGPCSPDTGEDFSICYSSSGATVAQLLGEQFGLSVLTPEEQSDPAFVGNVMQPSVSKRGEKLTLGQIFHFHSTLKTDDFPDCISASESCPPLTADAKVEP